MAPEELKQLLEQTGIPVTYNHWEQPPAPPYLVYLYSGSADLMADDCNYAGLDDWQVELYTPEKDPASEAKVETALKDARIPYQKTETYLDTERLYQILYLIRTT